CICFGGRLLQFEIGDARFAVAALHLFHVELDVGVRVAWQNAEEVAAELFARGAAQPMAPPDIAERMDARVSPAVDRGELFLQRAILPQRILNRRHLLRWQRLIKKGFEFGIGKLSRHTSLTTKTRRTRRMRKRVSWCSLCLCGSKPILRRVQETHPH